MGRHVQLNNVDHADLRIITKRSAALGDGVMSSPAFAFEFRNLQAHYPIFFHKNSASGGFEAAALLGFEKGENLFLKESGWDASYVPMVMEMQPFLIGFQNAPDADGIMHSEIHLDIDHPRVSRSEGERVFLDHGGNSDFLTKMAQHLDAVHNGHQANADFMRCLEKYDLLEPLSLEIELEDGSQNRLAGFYVIKEEVLYALGGEALEDLNKRQFLQPIFMAVASLSKVRELIDRKNAALKRL